MSRFHCRCRACQHRQVLRKKPEDYIIPPQCDICGKRNWRIDKWMNTRNTHKQGCTYPGYWFMHRMGSLYCWYRKDGSRKNLEDPDFADRELSHHPPASVEEIDHSAPV